MNDKSSDQETQRSRMEIVRDIDRIEYRLTFLQWEKLSPILDQLYAELDRSFSE